MYTLCTHILSIYIYMHIRIYMILHLLVRWLLNQLTRWAHHQAYPLDPNHGIDTGSKGTAGTIGIHIYVYIIYIPSVNLAYIAVENVNFS